ncbi:MAG: UDP-3-O-acyl-N-acetylglucosamine deacetylase, partial [Candidatus Omnitrophota bacterium]|nr:UDP-3-O-acyl-N-acetylglucosamine deacetylase [Candidatus Omnitrophota bacterium]
PFYQKIRNSSTDKGAERFAKFTKFLSQIANKYMADNPEYTKVAVDTDEDFSVLPDDQKNYYISLLAPLLDAISLESTQAEIEAELAASGWTSIFGIPIQMIDGKLIINLSQLSGAQTAMVNEYNSWYAENQGEAYYIKESKLMEIASSSAASAGETPQNDGDLRWQKGEVFRRTLLHDASASMQQAASLLVSLYLSPDFQSVFQSPEVSSEKLALLATIYRDNNLTPDEYFRLYRMMLFMDGTISPSRNINRLSVIFENNVNLWFDEDGAAETISYYGDEENYSYDLGVTRYLEPLLRGKTTEVDEYLDMLGFLDRMMVMYFGTLRSDAYPEQDVDEPSAVELGSNYNIIGNLDYAKRKILVYLKQALTEADVEPEVVEYMTAMSLPEYILTDRTKEMEYAHTLQSVVTIAGGGVIYGRYAAMNLYPAAEGRGLVFRVKYQGMAEPVELTLEPEYLKPAYPPHVTLTKALNGNNVIVHLPEHIVSALQSFGIRNAVIEIDGWINASGDVEAEVPTDDGSSRLITEKLALAGIMRQNFLASYINIQKPIYFRTTDGREYLALPDEFLNITAAMDFTQEGLGRKAASFDINSRLYTEIIAQGRTFVPASLVRAGAYAGVDIDNLADTDLLVYDDDTGEILNPGGYRFPNEAPVHKVLDLLGDLGAIDLPLTGQFIAYKAGHPGNYELVARILEARRSYEPEVYYRAEDDGASHIDHIAVFDPMKIIPVNDKIRASTGDTAVFDSGNNSATIYGDDGLIVTLATVDELEYYIDAVSVAAGKEKTAVKRLVSLMLDNPANNDLIEKVSLLLNALPINVNFTSYGVYYVPQAMIDSVNMFLDVMEGQPVELALSSGALLVSKDHPSFAGLDESQVRILQEAAVIHAKEHLAQQGAVAELAQAVSRLEQSENVTITISGIPASYLSRIDALRAIVEFSAGRNDQAVLREAMSLLGELEYLEDIYDNAFPVKYPVLAEKLNALNVAFSMEEGHVTITMEDGKEAAITYTKSAINEVGALSDRIWQITEQDEEIITGILESMESVPFDESKSSVRLWGGRTMVFPENPGDPDSDYIAYKFARQRRAISDLQKEADGMLSAGNILGDAAELYIDAESNYIHLFTGDLSGLPEGTDIDTVKFYIQYKAPKDYFRYLNDEGLAYGEILNASKKNLADIVKLLKAGYIHTSPCALSHTTARNWVWDHPAMPGEIRGLSKALAYPNMRLRGIADYEHIQPIEYQELRHILGQNMAEFILVMLSSGIKNNISDDEIYTILEEALRDLYGNMGVSQSISADLELNLRAFVGNFRTAYPTDTISAANLKNLSYVVSEIMDTLKASSYYELRNPEMNIFGDSEYVANRYDYPENFARDSGGNIYIVDSYSNLVEKFDKDGELILLLGRDGGS